MVDGSAPIEVQSIQLGEIQSIQSIQSIQLGQEGNFITSFFRCCSDCKTVENWQMVNNVTSETITDANIECLAEGGWVLLNLTLHHHNLEGATECKNNKEYQDACTSQVYAACMEEGKTNCGEISTASCGQFFHFHIDWTFKRGCRTAQYLVIGPLILRKASPLSCKTKEQTLGSFFAPFSPSDACNTTASLLNKLTGLKQVCPRLRIDSVK